MGPRSGATQAAEEPGNDLQSQYLYWAQALNPWLDCRNHGVGGERTEEILARLRSLW